MDHSVLNVIDLKKQFGDFTAVKGISFALQPGEILGFLGPNGAGKTTTIQMLLGLMTPTSGSISFFGKDFNQHRSEILQQVTFASAYTKLAPRLSILENITFYASLYGLNGHERDERIMHYLKLLGIWDIRHRKTGVLSAGQVTRVMLAKAFIPNPKIILLDEPTASLDPDIARDVRKFIVEQQKERQVSILFTSHNMVEIEEVCDRVLILKHGSIIADNSPDHIAQSIRKANVHLMLDESMLAQAVAYADEHGIEHQIEKPYIILTVNEDEIAKMLAGLAQRSVMYTQIYIDKPTLEDYFIQVAQDSQGAV